MRTRTRLVVVLLLTFVAVVAGPLAGPVAAGGGGCHRDLQFGPTEATGTTVEFVKFCLSTSVLRVDPGATVTFTNRDPMPHNVVGSGMFVDELGEGESAAYRFDDAGTFAYACTLHPGMVGAIVVGDGRRTAPATLPIVPVEVQGASTPAPTPTSLAPLPLASTTPVAPDDGPGLPIVPLVVALAAVGTIAFAAGRRRRPSDVTGS